MGTEAVDSSKDGFVLEDTKSSDKCWTTTIIRSKELWGSPQLRKGGVWPEYEEDKKLHYVLTIAGLCTSDHLSVTATL